jgi:CheY-like chemotaxis protein/HPt (histidine-containing phosphotransfer) domain-containing protein
MLLRLSRISFWLAAAAAAMALLAPVGHETLLTAVSGLACLLALGLWRSAARLATSDPGRLHAPPAAAVLDAPSLLDAAALLLRGVYDAPTFDAALHAASRVLRNELGAAEVQVHEVHDVRDDHARISDLIESQPGFRTTERTLRLDASPLAQALTGRREAGGSPDGSPGLAAVPVLRDGRVVALIALKGIGLGVEPRALTGLLEVARLALSQAAATSSPAAPSVAPDRRAGDRFRGSARAVSWLDGERPRRVLAGHPNVLVIEDSVVQPEATSRMLRRVGCRVMVASGMLDGLNALRKTQFDLVFVDLQLSGMGATEGMKRWRHDGSGVFEFVSASDTPAIALSVASFPGDGSRCRELGFDDHLCKPFRQSQLLDMLNRHLRPQAPAESADWPAHARGERALLAEDAQPMLDAAALARLTELDPSGKNRLLERVLQAFQTSVARLRPQLDAARGTGERAPIRLVAHTLKSSSASIGAMRLSQLCAQIETVIRLEEQDDLAPQLDALDDALDGALRAIESLLKERA